MEEVEILSLNYTRRFGVEIEINAFDGRSGTDDKSKLPEGTEYVAHLVQKTTKENVRIHKWGHNHNNSDWIIKPDSSCGIEVCSPVSKGWFGTKNICKVVEAFNLDRKIEADGRCSFHVHVEVADLNQEQIAAIISWWVKCEPVFMDSVPFTRKNNRYCQYIGLMDIFSHNSLMLPENLIKKLGYIKYLSLNTFHLKKANRNTIEFRIIENSACTDPYMAKNWIRLVIHFVEMAIRRGLPSLYEEGNQWSSYLWLDPIDVFEFLGFNDKYKLSMGLEQVKDWFLGRLMHNTLNPNIDLLGVCSDKARTAAFSQTQTLWLSNPGVPQKDNLFDNKFRV